EERKYRDPLHLISLLSFSVSLRVAGQIHHGSNPSLLLLDGASSTAQFGDEWIGAASPLLIWIQPPARPHHRFLYHSISSSISLRSPSRRGHGDSRRRRWRLGLPDYSRRWLLPQRATRRPDRQIHRRGGRGTLDLAASDLHGDVLTATAGCRSETGGSGRCDGNTAPSRSSSHTRCRSSDGR
uniref:Uncharacterized protein n=1 Tax=Oryza punctata TaxID=4537 RepID=A0A0E0M9U3_ORYPU